MAALPKVNPGDLITAADWNGLVDKVNNLEAIVIELQQGGTGINQNQVKIDHTLPASQVHRNEELQIFGVNFYRFIGATRVTLNGNSIPIKPTSTETQLNVDIPITLPLGPAVLEVNNSFTTDKMNLTILEQVLPLLNDIDITWLDVSPQRITSGSAGALYKFRYQVVSHTNRAAKFTFNPVVSVAAWQSGLKILDGNQAENTSRQMDLSPNQAPAVFYVQGPLSTALAAGGQFILRVDVTAENRTWSLGDHVFREGELVLPQDTDIELGNPTLDPTTVFDDVTNTLRMAPGSLAVMSFETGLKAVGTFNLVIDPPAPGGWKIEPFDLTTLTQVVVTSASLAAAGGRVPVASQLKFTAPGGSGVSAIVNIGFQNAAKTDSRTVDYYVLRTS